MRAEILEKIEITKNKKLTQVNLANLGITDDEIQEIMDEIQQSIPSISLIDLDNNNIGDAGATILSKYLRNFTKMTELSIQHNKIEKAGAIDLFSLKTTLPNLSSILFHGNRITNVMEMSEIEQLTVIKDNQSYPKPF